jgi:hypothetical protein
VITINLLTVFKDFPKPLSQKNIKQDEVLHDKEKWI